VMKKAAQHAKSVHKMVAISMDVEKKARAAIHDAGGNAGPAKRPG
jgi:predicted small metal-binding protein